MIQIYGHECCQSFRAMQRISTAYWAKTHMMINYLSDEQKSSDYLLAKFKVDKIPFGILPDGRIIKHNELPLFVENLYYLSTGKTEDCS